jgi:hypothetical protein
MLMAEKKGRRLPKILGIIALVIIAAAIFFAFPKNTSRDDYQKTTAHQLYERYLNDSQAITSIRAEYQTRISMPAPDSGVFFIEMRGNITQKGENRMDEVTAENSMDRQSVSFRSYIIDGQAYSCARRNESFSCGKVNTIISPSRGSLLKISRAIYDKGAISFFDVEEKNYLGGKCTFFNATYDIQMLSLDEKFLLLFSVGLSSMANPDKIAGNITSYSIQFCEREGVPLYEIAEIKIGNITRAIESSFLSYEINQPVDDSILALP